MESIVTGFGDLTLADFADALRPLLSNAYAPINEVCLCLQPDYRARELARHLFAAQN